MASPIERLSAAQLLSGVAGYTLPDRAVPDGDFPSLAEVDGEAGGRTRDVLGTRLFLGTFEGKLAPTHRQIAEFLAARHVSGLLDESLPLERILALITGFDGELLPSFSNFTSWLAVHNKRSRKRLSLLNPSGLIYAGDRQTYSADEKREIVLNLRREAYWNPWCTRSLSKRPGIGGIVAPELEGTFREILSAGERDALQACTKETKNTIRYAEGAEKRRPIVGVSDRHGVQLASAPDLVLGRSGSSSRSSVRSPLSPEARRRVEPSAGVVPR